VQALGDPFVFRGGKASRNRVALAALTNLQSHADGTLSDEELAWLERRARGGFGVVTTAASHVSRDGQGWPGQMGVFDDALLPGLRRAAAGIDAAGSLGLVQIFHGGLRADPAQTGQRPWSASEGASPEGARAATEEDLDRAICDFAAGARRAREAGFAGVEIHGAHGYLLTQFLSRTENRRMDRWGGSLENRQRLLLEVTRAVRAATPAPFIVGVRISPEDFGNARGLDLDESLDTARALVGAGIDFLHLSLWDTSRRTTKRPERHALEEFRSVVPADVALFVAGKVWTRADADVCFSLGADVVALGRSAIANPDWPLHAAEPGWEPRRPPLSPAELIAGGVSPRFVRYLRNWKNFVEETAG